MGSESRRTTIVHCITELIATLLFIYIGCGSCVSSYYTEKDENSDIVGVDSARLLVIAFAHGFAILILVFATAHVSGGHINPVVTLAMIVTGNISLVKGLAYIVCQFVGGIMGACLLRASFVTGRNFGAHNLGNGVTIFGGILIDVAVNPKSPSKFAPIAIGLAVLVDHLVGVPFTGASMNPARTLAAALVSDSNFNHLYVYFIGPPLGAVVAGLFYKFVVLNSQKQAEAEQFLINR